MREKEREREREGVMREREIDRQREGEGKRETGMADYLGPVKHVIAQMS